MNLPNKLTIARIVCTPIVMALFYMRAYILCAVVFVAASLTDLLDGRIARKRGIVTTFGKFFDPLADKIINLALIILAATRIVAEMELWYGIITGICTVLIVTRELLVLGFRSLAASEGIVIAADMWGKVKTFVQDIAVVALLFDLSPLFEKIPVAGGIIAMIIHILSIMLICASLVLTVLSGANYFIKNKEVRDKIKNDM